MMNTLRTDLRNVTNNANRRVYVAPANEKLADAVGMYTTKKVILYFWFLFE